MTVFVFLVCVCLQILLCNAGGEFEGREFDHAFRKYAPKRDYKDFADEVLKLLRDIPRQGDMEEEEVGMEVAKKVGIAAGEEDPDKGKETVHHHQLLRRVGEHHDNDQLAVETQKKARRRKHQVVQILVSY